jgi:hypothetical protein
MKLLHRFTIAKELNEPHLNEDAAFAFMRKGIYALSDGASESYASRRWARTLVARYACVPNISNAWIGEAIAAYDAGFDRETLSWSKQAAFDRGSFATLLGVIIQIDCIQVLGIGDSLAVIEKNGNAVLTHPYKTSAEFSARPLLLSTLFRQNKSIDAEQVTLRWPREQSDNVRIYLMTDALGAWLLEALEERLSVLRGISNTPDFVAFIESARADGSMRRDDTTLMVIS